jgi:hypothetical protein
LVLWLCAVGFGTFYLKDYENTPGGETASHPAIFPSDSSIERDSELPMLLVFAHPHCPCTRATIRELAKLMTAAEGRLMARVLFIKPSDFSADWTQTDLWENAAAIPGVSVALDDAGSEAAIFGAETSGIALLYDRAGNLLFQGGITASRGHEGDNDGRRSIVDFVTKDTAISGRQQPPPRGETFVYGCPLGNRRNCPPVMETEAKK